MPPAATRNRVVILYDLKMETQSSALHTFLQFHLYEKFSASKNECSLYFVNAAETDNDLNRSGIKRYFTRDLKDLIEDFVITSVGSCDLLEALEVAIDDLKPHVERPGLITLQILFITDLKCFERPVKKELYHIVEANLTDLDIFLYFVGPDLDPPNTLVARESVIEWMQNFQPEDPESTLGIIMQLVQSTPNSVVCNRHIGIHLFHSYTNEKGIKNKFFFNQILNGKAEILLNRSELLVETDHKECVLGRQPWVVPLSFGSILHLKVSTMRVTERSKPFDLKGKSSRCFTPFWACEDEQDKHIDIRDTVSGLVKHGKFVRMLGADRFKVEGPRSFAALFITKAQYLPEYLIQSEGGSYIVLPDEKQSSEYLDFMDIFIDQLAKANAYIVARRVYAKNNNPKFVVLIPRTDFNVKCFILCQLPYTDDIAFTYKEQNLLDAPKTEFDDKFLNFMEDIDITNEKCKIKPPMAPNMMIYPTALDIITLAEEKLGKLFKPTDLKADHYEVSQDLKTEWPAREVIKKEEADVDDFDNVDDFIFD